MKETGNSNTEKQQHRKKHTMRMKEVSRRVGILLKNKRPFLLTGSPGLGKTDAVKQACEAAGIKLIISHPVVSDPTDYKGMPAIINAGGRTSAEFLPFGDLAQLIDAKEPTCFFADDVGQSSPAVQAALMQLKLCRKINGHDISPHVTFAAATNRRTDKAGVGTFIAPLLDRFDQVYQLEFNVDDFVQWALENGQPESIVSFARWRPSLISDFTPPKGDLQKTPTPRSVAKLGALINDGLDDYDTYQAACGEGFATEFHAFNSTRKEMPDIAAILKNPDAVGIPTRPDVLYATAGALSYRATAGNFANVLSYADRMPVEFQILLVKDAYSKTKALQSTPAFMAWVLKHKNVLLN